MSRSVTLSVILSLFLAGCMVKNETLKTVPEVNLERYCGLWYEIAAFPQKFEKGCKCTTAEYKLTGKNYIRVINKCQKPGKFSSIEGKAFIVKGSGNAKLKVQFFWPFKGDYWIVELDPDYNWAAVGNNNRNYLWILCRRPEMQETLYNEILNRLTAKGFDISKLKKTEQNCK